MTSHKITVVKKRNDMLSLSSIKGDIKRFLPLIESFLVFLQLSNRNLIVECIKNGQCLLSAAVLAG